MIKERKKAIEWIENAGYCSIVIGVKTYLNIYNHSAEKGYYAELIEYKTVRGKSKEEILWTFKDTKDLDKLFTAIGTLFDVQFA